MTGGRTRNRNAVARTDRLERAMALGDVGWWELDVRTGAVAFDDRKATTLGYDPDAFETCEDFTALLHADDHDRATDAMRAHLDGEADRYDVEYRIRDADGTYRWFRGVGGVSERDDDGPVRVTGLVVDVGDQRARTELVEERNEALVLLNRLVRHDLRNDLNVLAGWLELFVDDPDELTTERLAELVTVAQRATELTESVRDVVAMVETGERVDTEPVPVGVVLRDEVDRARAAYPDATFDLRTVPDEYVTANVLLSSVFRNLLGNAVVHADRDDVTVVVDATTTDESVIVSVSDDGPGIPDDRKAVLFDPTMREVDRLGHGLGLYLVGSLVDAYGGSVAVADDEPRGTTFTVELDRA